MKNLVIAALAVICIGTGSLHGFQHPNMFLNQTEINAIKAKLSQEPWKSAYTDLMSQANGYMSGATANVLGGTVSPTTGNIHKYYVEPYYDTNPDRTDAKASATAGKAVLSLGLAYALTGQSKYADRALKWIYDWCLNPSTYMLPGNITEPGNSQGKLDIALSMPKLYYGADLIWNYSGWTTANAKFTRAEFQDWVLKLKNSSYSSPAITGCSNNWQDWGNVMHGASLVILEENAKLATLFDGMKLVIGCKMNDDGRMEDEYTRAYGIFYSVFSLNAISGVAEMARHHGVDLYHYTSGVRGLEKAYDYIAPYIANPASWPYKENFASKTIGMECMEHGYAIWHKSAYLSAINARGRLSDTNSRPVGFPTLTHSYGTYEWKVWDGTGNSVAAAPSFSPSPGTFTGPVSVTISTSTAGAQIRYTTDGSTPTAGSALYSSVFTVSSTATVKAIAIKSGLDNSSVSSGTYTITVDNTAPVISSVTAANNGSSVTVVFSEAVSSATGGNKSNFSISGGIAISAAAHSGANVTLSTSALSEDVTYTLTVNNVKDLSDNTIAANSTKAFTFKPLSMTDGVTAYWSMDALDGTTVADEVGTNDAANVDGVWSAAGKKGGCMKLVGGTGMTAGTGMLGMDQTNSFTIALWIKSSNVPAGDIFQRGQYSYPVRFFFSNEKLRSAVRVTDGNTYGTASTVVSADTWHHAAITYTNGTRVIYLDGQVDFSDNLAGDLDLKGAQEIQIGAGFNGSIDEMYVFNRALTAVEIDALMNGGASPVIASAPRYAGLPGISVRQGAGNDVLILSGASLTAQKLTAVLYDAAGQPVQQRVKNAGEGNIYFVLMDVPAGVYFYRLTGDGIQASGRVVIVK